MTNTNDPVPYRMRELALLRGQAAKQRRVSPCDDLTENALAMCDSLIRDLASARLESDKLRAEVLASSAAWECLFEVMPGACLVTDSAGLIVKANRAAGVVLNLSGKRLKDRELVLFSDDRESFEALCEQLPLSRNETRATLSFRPRERKATAMDVVVMPLVAGVSGLWLWFLQPVTAAQGTAHTQILGAGVQLSKLG